ncbi:hypothetical protein [Micromonospora sagamiensis]|uniref:hypothetical protein n=1 Tax=Micromonospora sagamiensis TaxID=47875 RepID=UPI0016482B28
MAALALAGCASAGKATAGDQTKQPSPGPAVFQPQDDTCHPFDQEILDALGFRSRALVHHPYEPEWRNGDRGVRCFLWREKPLTRSVRDGGTTALPVRIG